MSGKWPSKDTAPSHPKCGLRLNGGYAEKMKHYREVELPAYDAALEQYQEDMRAYYKRKHDNV